MCIMFHYRKQLKHIIRGLIDSEFYFTMNNKERYNICCRLLKYIVGDINIKSKY